MKLTQEAKAAYIAAGGIYCPFCKSKAITVSSPDVDGPVATIACSCGSCGQEWTDTYELQWGFFDQQCFVLDGLRTGPGYGQKYEKQADGKWLKTEG